MSVASTTCLPVSILNKILFCISHPCFLQSIQRKFGSITHASVGFLGERLQRMGNQFLSSLEVMTSHSQCPTVLLDAETVRLFCMVVHNYFDKTVTILCACYYANSSAYQCCSLSDVLYLYWVLLLVNVCGFLSCCCSWSLVDYWRL